MSLRLNLWGSIWGSISFWHAARGQRRGNFLLSNYWFKRTNIILNTSSVKYVCKHFRWKEWLQASSFIWLKFFISCRHKKHSSVCLSAIIGETSNLCLDSLDLLLLLERNSEVCCSGLCLKGILGRKASRLDWGKTLNLAKWVRLFSNSWVSNKILER